MKHIGYGLLVGVTSCLVGFGQEQKKESREPEQTVNEIKPGTADVKPGTTAGVDPKTYRIGAEDVIGVIVWREKDLSGSVLVRPDGKISMPLIGELEAAGKTIEELKTSLEEALAKVMNKPEVYVSIVQVNSKKYYITGEVNRTGPFPLITPIRVLEAISAAGGLREFAERKKIIILRGDKRIKFNYSEVIKGKNLAQNIFLEPGDQIFVP